MRQAKEILFLPGFGGSGPEHWQSLWERSVEGARRVEQLNWEEPDFIAWMQNFEAAIATCAGPPFVVAHSLGCAMVAHLAQKAGPLLAGALLVAPADVEEISMIYPELEAFAPMPLAPMPWKTVVVVSDDDVYVGPERAGLFAESWGARLVTLAAAGHINVETGFGDWPEGLSLLSELRQAGGEPN